MSQTDASAFANRLRKNLRHLGRWAQRNDVSCFRVYESDIPEFALAVDIYDSVTGERWVHAQEYAAPRTIYPEVAVARFQAAIAAIPEVLQIPAERVVTKQRSQQKGSNQYEKVAATGQFIEVREGPARFWVNLHDYLDTGLFLDHRITRELIGVLADGKRVLNLFAYTGAATVHAALGGASSTVTVDLSNTYLDWACRNLTLNGMVGARHEMVRADCLAWLDEQVRKEHATHYDVIFLDPPSFSNSKRMADSFDVQRDHVTLIRDACALLRRDGELIFSNNLRRFKLDTEALAGYSIEDISKPTLPKDFERNPRIHVCFRIKPPARPEPSDTQEPKVNSLYNYKPKH